MEVTAATIPLVAATSASGIRDEFEFGDVGLVCADPCTYNYADFRSDFELWDCDNGYFLFLAFNVSYSEDELFEDQRLRAAFTYAIDRAMLSEDIFRGYARPTTIAVDPNSPYFSASLSAKYEYDSMKFMGILENYYITRPIKLLVNSDDRLRLQTAREIARMLTEQGLVTETLEKASKEFNSAITRGDYDLYLGRTKLSANMDLSCFFHGNGSMRRNGVADPETYQLCVNALANHGNYYNLHQKVAEDARIVPLLFYGYSIYAERGLLSDLEPSRDNVFFYSLNKTMESIRIPTDYS
jgi:peptide/nickel transport system substrate-binding protein